MLSVSNLWKAFGGQDLFKGASFRVNPGDRIALIGPNGSGKSTLFDTLVGEESVDKGEIGRPSDLAIGYLRQETDDLRGNSVLEEVISGKPELGDASHRLHELEHKIAEAPEGESARLLNQYGRLRESFEASGGYEIEHEAKKILGGLAFRPQDFSRLTETFSGGWMMRIALAKLLVARPDLLILDEPTNHLDLASVEWLEKFLQGYGGTILFTSHDREFINGFARKIVEVRDHKLFEYTGNFDDFVEQRELAERQREQAAKQQTRKIAASTRFIERFRYKKTKARQVQS
ncbi:MAG: ABC-F family ATP-binding cassette domain-containing protein, partial [Acidimicrobiia bacterium]